MNEIHCKSLRIIWSFSHLTCYRSCEFNSCFENLRQIIFLQFVLHKRFTLQRVEIGTFYRLVREVSRVEHGCQPWQPRCVSENHFKKLFLKFFAWEKLVCYDFIRFWITISCKACKTLTHLPDRATIDNNRVSWKIQLLKTSCASISEILIEFCFSLLPSSWFMWILKLNSSCVNRLTHHTARVKSKSRCLSHSSNISAYGIFMKTLLSIVM